MTPWVLLTAAIATEVAGTLALRGSDGFSKLVPSVITVAGYVASFILLAIVLKSLPVGVVYAIWSAVGIALVAVLGKLIFDDPVPPLAIAGMVLIVGGVLLVSASGAKTH
ncbi:MAG: multidrug efflux SMR transporter [Chloroflexi bacterium]|nr:MAG: multidrug efflux SMR transporter [Chloroflexota bacterium]TME02871.1 MAG: multidrug efflux SMR transporter [Chloroflexota bacterium]TME43032.1 MAG: multidrug efflux SMR transporter [Chloroflexota bacterium]TME52839.1 MAG: multidrug efflux SMR transporter [Chloroflexota bacterium]